MTERNLGIKVHPGIVWTTMRQALAHSNKRGFIYSAI